MISDKCGTLALIFAVDVAVEREVEGDLIQGDMGYGMPFKPGTFDGVIRYVIVSKHCKLMKYKCIHEIKL